jgi:hypothetical protein
MASVMALERPIEGEQRTRALVKPTGIFRLPRLPLNAGV